MAESGNQANVLQGKPSEELRGYRMIPRWPSLKSALRPRNFRTAMFRNRIRNMERGLLLQGTEVPRFRVVYCV